MAPMMICPYTKNQASTECPHSNKTKLVLNFNQILQLDVLYIVTHFHHTIHMEMRHNIRDTTQQNTRYLRHVFKYL